MDWAEEKYDVCYTCILTFSLILIVDKTHRNVHIKCIKQYNRTHVSFFLETSDCSSEDGIEGFVSLYPSANVLGLI